MRMQPDYINTTESDPGTNGDIISVIEKRFPQTLEQTKDFAKQFEDVTLEKTAYNVWRWLKANVRYDADGSHQKIKSPARLVADGVGDCKSFALFIASIMSHYAPVGFRYTSYNPVSKIPTHVYAIIKDKIGRTIIADGVWDEFNAEKNFTHKIDHWMKVSYLSGINGHGVVNGLTESEKNEVTIIIDGLIKLRNQMMRTHPNHPHTEAFNRRIKELYGLLSLTGIGKHKSKGTGKTKKGKGGVKRIALSPLRNSFLGLVALNARGLATKLAKLLQKNPAKLQEYWEKKMGGKFSKLQSVVADGARKKPLLGESKKSKAMHGIDGPEIGVALAAALPVIIAVGKLLKANGISDEGTGGPGTDLDELVSEKASEFSAMNDGETPFDAAGPMIEVTDKGSGEDHSGGIPTWALVGGAVLLLGGAALYFSKN